MKRNLKRIELSPKHNALDCKSRRGIRKERNWMLTWMGLKRAERSREGIPGAGNSMHKGVQVGKTLNLTFPIIGQEEGRSLGLPGW